MSTLARRAIAEMIGTAILVFFGAGAVVMDAFPAASYHLFGIAMVHALALSLAVSMTMGISGGHLNPAVTVGMLVIRRITPRDSFVYVISQLVGALVAAMLVKSLMAPNVGRVLAFGAPVLNPATSFGQGVVIESILSFMLMSAVMGTIVASNAPRIAGFGVGLSLIPAIMVGGPLTGAALNPARAFGPAVVSGIMTAQAVWWIGPIIGAVAAALLWQYVLLRDKPEEPLVPTK